MLYRPPLHRAVACSSGSMTGKSSAEMPRWVDFPRSSPINVPSWDSQLKTSVPTPCQVWLTNRKTVQTIGDCPFNCHPQRRISYTGRILEILSASFMNKVSVVEVVDDHFVCGFGHIFVYSISEVLQFYHLSLLTSSNPCILGPKAIKQPVDFPPLEDKSFASTGESITNLFVRFLCIFFPLIVNLEASMSKALHFYILWPVYHIAHIVRNYPLNASLNRTIYIQLSASSIKIKCFVFSARELAPCVCYCLCLWTLSVLKLYFGS